MELSETIESLKNSFLEKLESLDNQYSSDGLPDKGAAEVIATLNKL